MFCRIQDLSLKGSRKVMKVKKRNSGVERKSHKADARNWARPLLPDQTLPRHLSVVIGACEQALRAHNPPRNPQHT